HDAEAQRGLAQENFRETLQTVDQILTGVGEELADVAGSQPARQKLLEAALHYYQEFRTKHGDDPGLQAELAQAPYRGGRVYDYLGKYEEAVAAYTEACDRQEQLARSLLDDAKTLRDLAMTYHHLGMLHRKHRKRAQADQALQQGLTIREKLVAAYPNNPEY